LPHRQAHDRAQQAIKLLKRTPDPSLPQGLLMQIQRGLVPLLTLRAPAFEKAMMDHLDRLRFRQFGHLSHPCQADAS